MLTVTLPSTLTLTPTRLAVSTCRGADEYLANVRATRLVRVTVRVRGRHRVRVRVKVRVRFKVRVRGRGRVRGRCDAPCSRAPR